MEAKPIDPSRGLDQVGTVEELERQKYREVPKPRRVYKIETSKDLVDAVYALVYEYWTDASEPLKFAGVNRLFVRDAKRLGENLRYLILDSTLFIVKRDRRAGFWIVPKAQFIQDIPDPQERVRFWSNPAFSIPCPY